MFKRELQVKMVKPKKKADDETETVETEVNDNASIVATVVDRGIKKIGLIICAYVVLDTFRKVLVEQASK